MTGHDQISELIGAVQQQVPGHVFRLGDGGVDAHHNVARFTWELVPAGGGESLAIGFDVAVSRTTGASPACSASSTRLPQPDRPTAKWHTPRVPLGRSRAPPARRQPIASIGREAPAGCSIAARELHRRRPRCNVRTQGAATDLAGETQLIIGDEIAGYSLESLIGRGGMGEVFRALDGRLARAVALKVLAPELVDDEAFRERILRESQLAASIDHPNVIPVYAAGEADGHVYIAMRLVEGSDLRSGCGATAAWTRFAPSGCSRRSPRRSTPRTHAGSSIAT